MLNIFKRKKKTTDHEPNEKLNGIIGEYEEDGFPIVVRFINEIPDNSIISRMAWFTVVSWKYDDSERNGMPAKSTNDKMLKLEGALETAFWKSDICKHAYNRTGNGLKEFNYYIENREEFMIHFNKTLEGHEVYPIEINFYEDPEWVEMHKIIDDFKTKK
ncbi:DUF695 domain-containing protein [Aureivirga sp. CE67]|uniref:DUF695 domain-containing protein n=1 Tax=Aureivirga sp. CE67 TaxID=1788983 RepID=UPI0018C972C3|nr:DUF695 domain-containing protein [Aureivirga sp. CE67]